jgi:hypothetical protein
VFFTRVPWDEAFYEDGSHCVVLATDRDDLQLLRLCRNQLEKGVGATLVVVPFVLRDNANKELPTTE